MFLGFSFVGINSSVIWLTSQSSWHPNHIRIKLVAYILDFYSKKSFYRNLSSYEAFFIFENCDATLIQGMKPRKSLVQCIGILGVISSNFLTTPQTLNHPSSIKFHLLKSNLSSKFKTKDLTIFSNLLPPPPKKKVPSFWIRVLCPTSMGGCDHRSLDGTPHGAAGSHHTFNHIWIGQKHMFHSSTWKDPDLTKNITSKPLSELQEVAKWAKCRTISTQTSKGGRILEGDREDFMGRYLTIKSLKKPTFQTQNKFYTYNNHNKMTSKLKRYWKRILLGWKQNYRNFWCDTKTEQKI